MKKILCYGNCILSTLGRWLHKNYSNKFEILDCEDCGVNPFQSTKNFAVWLDNKDVQQKYYHCVHNKIKKADYFLYQPMDHSVIDELKPEYLLQHIINGVSVRIPNFRFFAYPICSVSIQPYIKYIYKNITKNKHEIFKYLVNEKDPIFKKIIFEQYEKSMIENKNRFEKQILNYEKQINMLEFIEKNWKKHILFVTHNHPAGLYWNELVYQLSNILNENLELDGTKFLSYPSISHILNIKQFNFFNELFPEIVIPKEIQNIVDLKDCYEHPLPNHGLEIIQEPLEKYYD